MRSSLSIPSVVLLLGAMDIVIIRVVRSRIRQNNDTTSSDEETDDLQQILVDRRQYHDLSDSPAPTSIWLVHLQERSNIVQVLAVFLAFLLKSGASQELYQAKNSTPSVKSYQYLVAVPVFIQYSYV